MMIIKVKDSANRWKQVKLDGAAEERYHVYDAFVRGNLAAFGIARDDSNAISFLTSELAYTEAKTYATLKQRVTYQRFLEGCIDGSAGPAAETVNYDIVDHTGRGERKAPGATTMPLANVAYSRKSMNVVPGWIGFQYDLHDLQVATQAKKALVPEMQNAASGGFDRHIDRVALIGESISGFTGLFNNSTVPSGNRPSGAVWDAATADTILSDINYGIQKVWDQSGENIVATKLIIPAAHFGKLLMPRASGSDLSLLQWLEKNNVAALKGATFSIDSSQDLNTLGASSSKRAMFYAPTMDNVVMHLPMPLTYMAPQLTLTNVVVPGLYRYGGTHMRIPVSAYYMDTL